MHSRQRLGFVLACALPVALGAGIGCIPDPKGDFDDYTDRTGDFRKAPADSGAVDSAPPEGSVQGLYYGACLSTLAAGRVDRVLRFYTEVNYVADGPGAKTGKIDLKLTPMKLGPNNGPPEKVSKEWTTGQTYTVPATATNANGVYAAPLGTVNVPGNANPISGRDIIVEDAQVPGRFAKEKFCSQLIGHVVQPTDIPLEGDKNTCIYFPVKEGDVPPTLKLDGSDFPSTCTLN